MGTLTKFLETRPAAKIWLAWLTTRACLIAAIIINGTAVDDVRYYYRGVTGTEPSALAEYPAVGVWPLWLIEKVSWGGADGYVIAFIATCVLLDAAFLALLHRHHRAAIFWVSFGAMTAFVLYLRLDIFQGVIVALAGWFLAKDQRFSAALLGIAAMMKLWPAILAAGLVGRGRKIATWVRVAIFAATCVVLAGLVVINSGIDRLISPLSYQQVRGLQIESLLATPFMVLSAMRPGVWTVDYASSKSFEIFGPGVSMAAQVTSWMMYAVVAFAFGWALLHFLGGGVAIRRRGRKYQWNAQTSLAWMIVIILLLIASNKVFSPQYVLWVGPLVAVALVHDEANRRIRQLAWLLVVLAALSTFIYPIAYDQLTNAPTSLVLALILALRNVLLLVAMVLAGRYLRHTVRKQESALDQEPETHREPAAVKGTTPNPTARVPLPELPEQLSSQTVRLAHHSSPRHAQ